MSGAKVLIAGAGGLGSACAKAFDLANARLAIADRDPDRLTGLSEVLGQDCISIPADLTDPDCVRDVVAEANSVLGGIDVLVHAVGINIRKPVLEIDPDEWHRIQTVNLDSAFWLSQAAGKIMTSQGHGRIVIISSVSGLLAHAQHAPYAASKGAINQMMRVMAREWAPFGVTVNAVAPGYIETELTQEYLNQDGHREALSEMVPAGRLGSPDELSGPVLFLASRQASFVTGHVLYVDGGRTLV
ncbi:MAG: SDR family oxidoreductase [Acidimicrobiaceae bacterium]|nr:SDR family oxidoreductase [Acidimicrobiaceae bacterium]